MLQTSIVKSRSTTSYKHFASQLQKSGQSNNQLMPPKRESDLNEGLDQIDTMQSSEGKRTSTKPVPKQRLAPELRRRVQAGHTPDPDSPTPSETLDVSKYAYIVNEDGLKLDFDSDTSDKGEDRADTASVAQSAISDFKTEVTETELNDLGDTDSCIATSIGTELLKLDSARFTPSKMSEHDFTNLSTMSDTDKSQDVSTSGLDKDDLETPRSMSSEGNHGYSGFYSPQT